MTMTTTAAQDAHDALDAPAAAAAADSATRAPASASTAPPRVSVVVPTCRRPELLLRCLQALLAQDLPPEQFEIVVVDDARCDWTQTVMRALAAELPSPTLRYLRPAHGRGPATARNTGWRAAHGPVIAFTDDDTVPAPEWLSAGLAALDDDNGGPCAALAGRVVVPLPGRPPTDHERMTQGLEQCEFVTANAFVRRQALLQVQGFDERFTRAWREDSDLQFRLLDEVGPVGRCDRAVVLHPVRHEPWGVSLRQQKNAFFEALLYAKHPRRYRTQAGVPIPASYYAIVALTFGAAVLAMADIVGSAVVCALLALVGVVRFALRRLRGTSHEPAHVLEMFATAAVIPFLSVYWRLRGALHFRVWFY